MKRQTRRMKDIAKRGLVGLLTVSMCLSNVQGIAFADNRVEVGGAVEGGNAAVGVLLDALALDEISTIRRTSPPRVRRLNLGGGTSAKSSASIHSSRVKATLRVVVSLASLGWHLYEIAGNGCS